MATAGHAWAEAGAQVTNPGDTLNQQRAKRGWFFYEDPKKPEEPVPAPSQPVSKNAPPPKKGDPCKSKTGWVPSCGFVDPGNDFAFQAKQRDALIERMSISKNDAKAVEDFQRYMHWAVGRATEVANLWYYNTVQNPELDPSVNQPISTFGVRLMTDVQSSQEKDILKALKNEGAALVFFTRSDCTFCRSMAPLVAGMAQETGLEVWNAALDDQCEPAFKDRCRTGQVVLEPAQALKVNIVPTLFLALPDNTWIRVATGVTDTTSIKVRIVNFFSAYRNALLKGMHSDNGKPAVDFAGADATGTAAGVKVPAPTEADVAKLLGR